MHNSTDHKLHAQLYTDHKPHMQLGLSTVKLCLMSAVFHKVYNEQLHQFGPEVFRSEIMWLVTLRKCHFT